MSTSDKWQKERQAARAVQIAFDLGHEVSYLIRTEALERGINPPDRIREILGLPVSSKPIRPRLSISLTEEDFAQLAEEFGVDPSDKLKIRQIAAEKLLEHLDNQNPD